MRAGSISAATSKGFEIEDRVFGLLFHWSQVSVCPLENYNGPVNIALPIVRRAQSNRAAIDERERCRPCDATSLQSPAEAMEKVRSALPEALNLQTFGPYFPTKRRSSQIALAWPQPRAAGREA